MHLPTKWTVWFAAIGLYAACLGGIFFYSLYKWTFDEQLKREALDLVRRNAPTLVQGLARSPQAITMDEFEILNILAQDPRVADLLYINRFGEIRWFKDPSKMGENFDQFVREVTLPTSAINDAGTSRIPKMIPVPNLPLIDVAVPLTLKGGELLGIVDLQVSREGVLRVINQAMSKYVLGAAGLLILLATPFYLFLHYWVIVPLASLRESVETLSFKSLDLKYATRRDEIGELASAIQIFLGKVKAELTNALVKEKHRGEAESRWWQAILTAIVPRTHAAIVVDEDNSVLYTNFALAGSSSETRYHLLDVIDAQQQEVLRLVGVALDRPNQVVEGDTYFRGDPCHLKAIHLQEEGGGVRRTLIVFEPKQTAVRI